jgi:hypothetical protein
LVGGSGERAGVHQHSMCKQVDDTGPWLKAAADLEDALPGADWVQRSGADPLPTALVHSCAVVGRGLHSFPFPLNSSLLCPFPLIQAHFVSHITQTNPWTCPEGAQVELYRERCVPEGPQVELCSERV